MADPTLRVRQTLDNTQFKRGLKDSQSTTKSLAGQMKMLGGVMAAAFSVTAVVGFFKSSLEGLDKQQKAENKLYTALKGRADVTNSLIRDASRLQGMTLFGDEVTIEAYAQLAAFVKNEEALKRLMPLVQDMATATGMDLVQASSLVGKSLGSSTNALARYGIKIEGAVGSNERLNAAITELTAKFEGQATAAADTALGAIEQMRNAWGDFGETLGVYVAPALTSLAKGLQESTEALSAMTATKSLSFWDKLKIFLAGTVGDASTMADVLGNNLEPALEESTFTEQKFTEITDDAAESLKNQADAAKTAARELRSLNNESLKKITGGINPVTTEELIAGGTISPQQQQILGAMSQVGGSRITGMQLPTEDLSLYAEKLQEVQTIQTAFTDQYETDSSKIQAATEAIGSAFGTAVGEFIKGEAKFSEVAVGLLQSIIKIVAGYLTESVAASFAGGASAGGPLAPFSGAAAAAAAISLFGSIVPALMANGGIVPGGYPNDSYPALLTSGEAVVPPHKLDTMMGSNTVVLETKVKGEDLYFIQKKMTSKHQRYT